MRGRAVAFGESCGQHTTRRHSDQIAPASHAAGELDRGPDLALGLLIGQRPVDLRERVHDEHLRTLPVGRRTQVRVDLLGDERHHRVGKGKRLLEHPQKRRRRLALAVIEARLDDLQIPVAEFRPKEAIELLRRV